MTQSSTVTVRCMKTLHFHFIESRVSFIQKALTFSWKLSPNSHQILLAHNLQLPLNIKHQLPLGSSGIHLGCLCVFGIIFSEGVNAISCNTILQLLAKIRKTNEDLCRQTSGFQVERQCLNAHLQKCVLILRSFTCRCAFHKENIVKLLRNFVDAFNILVFREPYL